MQKMFLFFPSLCFPLPLVPWYFVQTAPTERNLLLNTFWSSDSGTSPVKARIKLVPCAWVWPTIRFVQTVKDSCIQEFALTMLQHNRVEATAPSSLPSLRVSECCIPSFTRKKQNKSFANVGRVYNYFLSQPHPNFLSEYMDVPAQKGLILRCCKNCHHFTLCVFV